MSCFTSGNSTIIGAALVCLEQVMTNKITTKVTMGQSRDSVGGPSANRTGSLSPPHTHNQGLIFVPGHTSDRGGLDHGSPIRNFTNFTGTYAS